MGHPGFGAKAMTVAKKWRSRRLNDVNVQHRVRKPSPGRAEFAGNTKGARLLHVTSHLTKLLFTPLSTSSTVLPSNMGVNVGHRQDVVEAFDEFRKELDEHHDRRERLIKVLN
jgi:hypothetical protein